MRREAHAHLFCLLQAESESVATRVNLSHALGIHLREVRQTRVELDRLGLTLPQPFHLIVVRDNDKNVCHIHIQVNLSQIGPRVW